MQHEHTFTEEETMRQLSALQDSVNLIDRLILENNKSEETVDYMDRNVRHIYIMCDKKHLQDYGTDLTPFIQAAERGNAWLTGA